MTFDIMISACRRYDYDYIQAAGMSEISEKRESGRHDPMSAKRTMLITLGRVAHVRPAYIKK